MKCGRDTTDEQVFCQDCLAVMEKYPVRPGTVIHLPRREEHVSKKSAPAHAARTPEEIIVKQRSAIRWLCLALAVLVAAFALTAVLMLQLLDQRDNLIQQERTSDLGQNYTVLSEGE